jgi:hypothetical protein
MENRRSYQVEIVLPDGYRGKIRMVFEAEHGFPSETIDGKRVFRVSDDGEIHSRAENPFLKWGERLIVRERGGRVVEIAVPLPEAEPTKIMYRPIGGPPDGREFWAVVGTAEDLLKASWAFRNPGHEHRK